MRRKEERKESERFEGDGGDEMLVNKGGSFEMRGRRKEEGRRSAVCFTSSESVDDFI